MLVKGKAYCVIRDTLGYFRPGSLVVCLENTRCAYCIDRNEYSDADMKLAEDLYIAKVTSSGMPDIPDNWHPMHASELKEVLYD